MLFLLIFLLLFNLGCVGVLLFVFEGFVWLVIILKLGFFIIFVYDKVKDSGNVDVIVFNSSFNFFFGLIYDIFRFLRLLLFEFSKFGFVNIVI